MGMARSGFSVLYARPEERFAYLDRKGAQIMIEEHCEPDMRSWIADTRRDAGARNFLEMEEKCYRRDNVLLGVRQFIVLDPDGYLLRFSESLSEKST